MTDTLVSVGYGAKCNNDGFNCTTVSTWRIWQPLAVTVAAVPPLMTVNGVRYGSRASPSRCLCYRVKLWWCVCEQGEDNVSVDDEFDLSQWNPGSPGAIRAHGERLAMSPSDFSSPGVVYGDQLQPRRRF